MRQHKTETFDRDTPGPEEIVMDRWVEESDCYVSLREAHDGPRRGGRRSHRLGPDLTLPVRDS
jgi:hypothetical protein